MSTEDVSASIKLKKFNLVETVCSISGLLTDPAYHENSLRLEALVDCAIGNCKGKNKGAPPDVLELCLNDSIELASMSSMEDPAEDIFLSNVMAKTGDFRIFSGLWESPEFYLQLILDTLQGLNTTADTSSLRNSVFALLKLSEGIARRRNLRRGTTRPRSTSKESVILPGSKKLQKLGNSVRFSDRELQKLGIRIDELSPFLLTETDKADIHKQPIRNGRLERRPLICGDGEIVVAIPSSVTTAIRHYVYSWAEEHGLAEYVLKRMSSEYLTKLSTVQILGTPFNGGDTNMIQRLREFAVAQYTLEFDLGRFLHLFLVFDTFDGFEQGGLGSMSPHNDSLSDIVESGVITVNGKMRQRATFKEGMTLVLFCGYGRGCAVPLQGNEDAAWEIAMIPAPDFWLMTQLPDEPPLFLWSFLRHYLDLIKHGYRLGNINGFLNLYGWYKSNDSFILPREVDPRKSDGVTMMATNFIYDARIRVRKALDIHAARYKDATYIQVRTSEDNRELRDGKRPPFYISPQALQSGQLLGLFEGHRNWWLEVKGDVLAPCAGRNWKFELWQKMLFWYEFFVPVVEERVPLQNTEPIHIFIRLVDFSGIDVDAIDEDRALEAVTVDIDRQENSVTLTIRGEFLGAFQSPLNIAERVLISKAAKGVLALFELHLDPKSFKELFEQIIPNDDARFFHAFLARDFRDIVSLSKRVKTLVIEDIDVCKTRTGLGWPLYDGELPLIYRGRKECTAALNKVVDLLWCRVKAALVTFERRAFIERCLESIDANTQEANRWRRTIRALESLKRSREKSYGAAISSQGKLTMANVSLRILIEMAVSECPTEGKYLGSVDLASLMADVACLFHMGGWSDAIHKELMQDYIEIAPNGDVLAYPEAIDCILDPMARRFHSDGLEQTRDEYSELYETPEVGLKFVDCFEREFLDAFESEFGVPVDSLRVFRLMVENMAIEDSRFVIISDVGTIIAAISDSESMAPEWVYTILDNFSIWPKKSWDSTPPGFKARDWEPWSFGRRLSLLSRPIVRIEDGEDPKYAIAPGTVGDGFFYVVDRFNSGRIDPNECKSKKMKTWVDGRINKYGHEFVVRVCEQLESQGFEVRAEKRLDELLNTKLDADYGDVDVLAWKQGFSRMYAIECKRLRMAKTPGEIGEQLNRFAGECSEDGEPDELKKHLARCELLRKRSGDLVKTLGLSVPDMEIVGVVCTSIDVPMRYVSERYPGVSFLTFEELGNL